MAEATPTAQQAFGPTLLPRLEIKFCTQCKWMLRAAYFAQELLSTFSTSIGEVALQPSTGGTFIVTLTHLPAGTNTTSTTTLWDRKTEGGFPETKELKRRLRDVIQPDRDLGHVDRKHGKATPTDAETRSDTQAPTPAATMSSSASDIVSQLKKHPANKDRGSSGGVEEKSLLNDDARAAIAAVGANKGQEARAEISPAGQIPGQQQQQQQQQQPAADNKDKCEDCA